MTRPASQSELRHSLINRGLVLETLERFAEALESYDRALAIVPDFAEAWLNRGNTLQRLDRLTEALESDDRALAIRPDISETLLNRGNILQQLGRLAEALESYDRAVLLERSGGRCDRHGDLCRDKQLQPPMYVLPGEFADIRGC